MPVSNTANPGVLLPDLLSPMTIMNLRALQLRTVPHSSNPRYGISTGVRRDIYL
jgi:hypothetical protein